MAKKSERKKLLKKLDDLIRLIIRLIANDCCEKCGKYVQGSDSQVCHVVAKGNGASKRRFDLINVFLGCMHCHRWWHLNPTESGIWYAEKWPHRNAYLKIYRGGKPAKISTVEMSNLVVVLEKKLKLLKAEL